MEATVSRRVRDSAESEGSSCSGKKGKGEVFKVGKYLSRLKKC